MLKKKSGSISKRTVKKVGENNSSNKNREIFHSNGMPMICLYMYAATVYSLMCVGPCIIVITEE